MLYRTLCVVALALAAPAAALRVSVSTSRRSALTGLVAGSALVAVPAAPALAACLGKCPEDPAKVAERLANQQAAQSSSPITMEQRIANSIAQKEKMQGGMELSDSEKARVEASVRAAYGGGGGDVKEKVAEKKVKARFRTE